MFLFRKYFGSFRVSVTFAISKKKRPVEALSIQSAIPYLHDCYRDKGKYCNYDGDDILFCHDFLL